MAERPLKDDECRNLRWRAGIISERPVCAQLIGQIVAEWSSAESYLAQIYARLLFGEFAFHNANEMGGFAAWATFDQITSVKQRVAMLKEAAERRFIFSKAQLKEFAALLKWLQAAGDNRVTAAHGRWGIADDLPQALIWTRTLPFVEKAMVYDEATFRDALNRILSAVQSLTAFFAKEMEPVLKASSHRFVLNITTRKNIPKPIED